MKPFFNNTTVGLYGYSDTNQYDKRGQKIGEYALREIVSADIQPMSVKDQIESFGKILQDTYKLFLDFNVEVYDTDMIKINDDTYSILGSPEVWNHILQYKQLTIQKQRKATL